MKFKIGDFPKWRPTMLDLGTGLAIVGILLTGTGVIMMMIAQWRM